MAITQEIDNWLRQTYEHHCFISWPHIKNREIAQCAKAVQENIREELAAKSFYDPHVFLDESELVGGDDWAMKLRRALCKSISMVAICTPMYYRPEHRWCGLEWAAMEQLSSMRLRGRDFKAIIPLIVRTSDALPPALSRFQYIDVSRVTLLGRRYFTLPEFRGKIQQIVTRIEQIAEALWRDQVMAECDLFQFPKESAFFDYGAPALPFPIVS